MNQTADLCVLEHRRDPERPRPAVDGLYVCHGCLDQLQRLLTELPKRYAELERVLAGGGSASGPRVSGSASEPLPINPAAVEHRHQIQHDLLWWCIYVADERGIARPAASTPSVTARWLTRHADWCAGNRAAAEELLPVLRELTGRARAMIDPDGAKRITIGPCIAAPDGEPCEGTLYATVRADDDPRPSLIYCDTCDLEKSPIEWLRFGRVYQRGKTA